MHVCCYHITVKSLLQPHIVQNQGECAELKRGKKRMALIIIQITVLILL